MKISTLVLGVLTILVFASAASAQLQMVERREDNISDQTRTIDPEHISAELWAGMALALGYSEESVLNNFPAKDQNPFRKKKSESEFIQRVRAEMRKWGGKLPTLSFRSLPVRRFHGYSDEHKAFDFLMPGDVFVKFPRGVAKTSDARGEIKIVYPDLVHQRGSSKLNLSGNGVAGSYPDYVQDRSELYFFGYFKKMYVAFGTDVASERIWDLVENENLFVDVECQIAGKDSGHFICVPTLMVFFYGKRTEIATVTLIESSRDPIMILSLKGELESEAIHSPISSPPTNSGDGQLDDASSGNGQSGTMGASGNTGQTYREASAQVYESDRSATLSGGANAVDRAGPASSQPAAIPECDRLAASPYNTDNPVGVTGLQDWEIEPTAAIASCRSAVEHDPESVRAKFNLANALYMSKSVSDKQEALELFRLLDESDYPVAVFAMGIVYLNGNPELDLQKQPKEARQHIARAASHELPIAKLILGQMMEYGIGGGQDRDEALELYYASARAGLPEAQYALANTFMAGKLVKRDTEMAVNWMTAAANQGFSEAQNELGLFYAVTPGVPHDHAKAVSLWMAASSRGNIQADNNLAYMYARGLGVALDHDRAAELYLKVLTSASEGKTFTNGKSSASVALEVVNISKDIIPPQTVAALQNEMKARGVYNGSVDGILGSATRRAMRAICGC